MTSSSVASTSLKLCVQPQRVRTYNSSWLKAKSRGEESLLLGFVMGCGLKTVQPGKADALRNWPDPSSLDDVASFRAIANYLREFTPRFQALDMFLNTATQKGCHLEALVF